MKVVRRHPSSYQELLDLILQASAGARTVVMQTGHFLLYYDTVEDQLLPCVSTELHSPRHKNLREYAGGFPLESWRMGLDLLSALPAANKHVMIVVNDWQYLPSDVDRLRFYSKFKRLPTGYDEALKQHNGKILILLPTESSGTIPFFGEMNLRNQYKRNFERLLERDQLPNTVVSDEIAGEIICSLPETIERNWQIYCSGKTGDCAAEIAQVQKYAYEATRFDCFINLYPAVCRDFVERGTNLAQSLDWIDKSYVINIGFATNFVNARNDLFSACEYSEHRVHNVTK